MKPKIWKSALSLALLGGAILAPMAFISTDMNPIDTNNTITANDTARIINETDISNDNDQNQENDALENNVILEQGAYTYGDEAVVDPTSYLMLTFDATNLESTDIEDKSDASLYYRVRIEGSEQWGHFVQASGDNGRIYPQSINYVQISEYKDHTGYPHSFIDGVTYEIEFYISASDDAPANYNPTEDGYADMLSFTWTQNNTNFEDASHTVDQPLFEFTNITSEGKGVSVELVSTLGWGTTSTNYTISEYDLTVTNLSNADDGDDTNDSITVSEGPTNNQGGIETFGIDITELDPEIGDQIIVEASMDYSDTVNAINYTYALQSDVVTVTDFKPANITLGTPTFVDNGDSIDATMQITIDDPDEVLQLGGFPGEADTAIAFTGGSGYIDANDNEVQDEAEGTVGAIDFADTTDTSYTFDLHINDLEYGTQYYITMETLQYTETSGVELIFDYTEFTTPEDPNPETDKLDGWVIPVVSTLGALLVIALGWLAYATFLKRKYKKHRLTPEEKMDCQIKGQILELNAMKISELRKEADALKIADTKGKNKTELINMIVAHFFNPEALENPKEMEEIEKTTELVMSEIVK